MRLARGVYCPRPFRPGSNDSPLPPKLTEGREPHLLRLFDLVEDDEIGVSPMCSSPLTCELMFLVISGIIAVGVLASVGTLHLAGLNVPKSGILPRIGSAPIVTAGVLL